MDAAIIRDTATDNNKTAMTTRRRSRRTEPKEGTSLPTTTKQGQRRDAAADGFDDKVLRPRRRQRQQDSNGDNMKSLTISKKKDEVLQYLIKVCLFLLISENVVFENKKNKQIQYLREKK